eukprot:1197699-Amphidinium_carterae.1
MHCRPSVDAQTVACVCVFACVLCVTPAASQQVSNNVWLRRVCGINFWVAKTANEVLWRALVASHLKS